METTLEEARRCPRCQQPAVEIGKRRIRETGGTEHTFQCRNSRCRWHNSNFTVDTRPDGSIPLPNLNRQKFFPKVPDRTQQVRESVDKQLANETGRGNPELPRN